MSDGITLGTYLSTVRAGARLSLRDVERQTGGLVSNAYLSQIENGRARKPSLDILLSLGAVYGINWLILAHLAGHPPPYADADGATVISRSVLGTLHVTEEEERQLLRYLRFLRWEDNA